MRKIAGEKPGTEVEYIPKAYGNRDDPDPVRVWLIIPSNRERRKLAMANDRVEIRKDPDNPGGDPLISTRLASNAQRHEYVIEHSKMRVEKYNVYGVPIVDGPSMAEHGENDIVREMHGVIMGHCDLTEDEVKKSEGPPSSSKLATPALTETAPTAPSVGSR